MPYLDADYAFTTAFLPPLVTAAQVPPGEGATLPYITGRLAAAADIPVNLAAAEVHALFDPMDRIEDYDDLFVTIPAPLCTRTWRSDQAFAEQRLSGVHPVWIQACSAPPAHLDSAKVTEALTHLGATSSALFVCDYRALLADLPAGTWERGSKILPQATGLFAWRPTQHGDRGELVPVAIHLVGAGTFTPFDSPAQWSLARSWFQVADANVHEMRSHLLFAHFAMEPLAVATGRYLSASHPVRRFLKPHLAFLLFNNELGKKRLVNPGGYVDQLLGAALTGSLEIVKRAAASFDFTKDSFAHDLVARGVADANLLPHYPYRDDGQLLWDAIGVFAKNWVAHDYADDAAIAADADLGTWWTSLSAPTGAAISGIPSARTPANLAFMLQRIVFTSGPYHAAVNYPQYEYMAFSANQPLAAYAPWPTTWPSQPDAALLANLPPFKQAVKQLEVMELLASYRHDRLGSYLDGEHPEPWQQGLASQFRQALAVIEGTIANRNLRRRTPYIYLLPSLITNSTSV